MYDFSYSLYIYSQCLQFLITNYRVTNLCFLLIPIFFSYKFSSSPIYYRSVASISTPQSILSAKLIGGFLTMFLKDQVYFFIPWHLFVIFTFYFFILNLLICEGFWTRRSTVHNTIWEKHWFIVDHCWLRK